jgi:soluble lytic murein transglycosylase-like protein
MTVARHNASAPLTRCDVRRRFFFSSGLHRLRGTLALFTALLLLATLASATDLARLRNGFTIRHERRVTIGDNTRLFLANDNASFVDIPTANIEGFEKDDSPPPAITPPPQAAAKPQLSEVVQSASDRYRLDPDLVNSVIHAESGFNPKATSNKGAQGLMQLMPQTATKLGVSNRLDPQENVEGGTRYLRELLELYNFDLVKALAAYNAGPGRVQQYGGVPPYRETRAYVSRIVRDFNRKKTSQHSTANRPTHQAAEKKTTSP